MYSVLDEAVGWDEKCACPHPSKKYFPLNLFYIKQYIPNEIIARI